MASLDIFRRVELTGLDRRWDVKEKKIIKDDSKDFHLIPLGSCHLPFPAGEQVWEVGQNQANWLWPYLRSL